MNRVLLSCVSLLSLISGCTSPSALSTHDAGRKTLPVESGTHEELRRFDIAAGNAPITLNEFSRQADTQILFDYVVLRDRQTHAVEGMMQPSEALRVMLKGTGLVAGQVNERTIAITPEQSKNAAQPLTN